MVDQRSLLLRLWHGESPLPVVYWGFGILGNATLWLLWFGVALGGLIAIPLALVLLLLALVGYSLFIAVAVWRSARRSTAKPAWRVLARVTILLGPLALAAYLTLVLIATFAMMGVVK